MTISDHYQKEKQRYLDNCIQCGFCAEECPILSYTDISNTSALDIMEAIGDDYAFLPGLDYCCGDSHLFLGGIDKGAKRAEELMAAIAGFQPEAVVTWCPTCQCRFDKSIAPGLAVPFRVLSFAQYLAKK